MAAAPRAVLRYGFVLPSLLLLVPPPVATAAPDAQATLPPRHAPVAQKVQVFSRVR